MCRTLKSNGSKTTQSIVFDTTIYNPPWLNELLTKPNVVLFSVSSTVLLKRIVMRFLFRIYKVITW